MGNRLKRPKKFDSAMRMVEPGPRETLLYTTSSTSGSLWTHTEKLREDLNTSLKGSGFIQVPKDIPARWAKVRPGAMWSGNVTTPVTDGQPVAGVCCLLITGSAVAVYYERAHLISSAKGSLDRFWIPEMKTRRLGHMPPGLDEASNHNLYALPLSQQCWAWLPTALLVNTIFPDGSIIVSFDCVLTKEPELVTPPPVYLRL